MESVESSETIPVFIGTSNGAVIELSLDLSNHEHYLKHVRRVDLENLELCKSGTTRLERKVEKIFVNPARDQVHVVYNNFITSMAICSTCQ